MFGISIHAPREGCDYAARATALDLLISIHAPREGCDISCRFFSIMFDGISIHAPREGCDVRFAQNIDNLQHFNPRTP